MTTANVDDRQGALAAIERGGAELDAIESVLGDGGYTGAPFARSIDKQLQATVQIAQRPLASAFEVIPQRWVVERSFAWLEKCRRLWKNCERYLHTSLQFVILSFLALLARRL